MGAPIHPKAMPVILTTEAEIEQWMTAPAGEALTLQRPPRDGTLKVVMTGEKRGWVGRMMFEAPRRKSLFFFARGSCLPKGKLNFAAHAVQCEEEINRSPEFVRDQIAY